MYIIAAYLVIALSVLVLAKKTVQLEKEAERNQLIQSYMVTLQGFYQTIQSQIDMTRKFRHEELMEEQNESELREYADSLKQEYRQVENKGESESEVVNAILSMKGQQCREKNIPFCMNIEEKGYALVRDIDMVGLLVNLLDNAIEENERIESEEQRGIWLDMKEKEQGEVWLQIKNKLLIFYGSVKLCHNILLHHKPLHVTVIIKAHNLLIISLDTVNCHIGFIVHRLNRLIHITHLTHADIRMHLIVSVLRE